MDGEYDRDEAIRLVEAQFTALRQATVDVVSAR